MGNRFTFGTDDPVLAQNIMNLMTGGPVQIEGVGSVAPPTPATAPALTMAVPQPPVVTAPPAAPAAPTPAPAPTPPPAAQPAGDAPPGWTIDHVRGAAQALAQNPAKGGPAALKALLQKFGAKAISDLDPARWPEFYSEATA